MAEVLTVTGLNKRFGGIVVADSIDLSLSRGRVLGLIGPNGAGKTSLFNLVCGVVRPDSGTIALNGRPSANCRSGSVRVLAWRARGRTCACFPHCRFWTT